MKGCWIISPIDLVAPQDRDSDDTQSHVKAIHKER